MKLRTANPSEMKTWSAQKEKKTVFSIQNRESNLRSKMKPKLDSLLLLPNYSCTVKNDFLETLLNFLRL